MSLPPREMGRPSSTTVSEASTAFTSSTVDTTSASKGSRSSVRVHSFGKREQAIKRNPNVPVAVRGWLYKQDSTGMRLWKRKWFVLADYCLFYYKDSREESVLGSIPLPSYVISPVAPEDHISRKFAFKASHTGMRSYIYKQSSMIGSQAEHSGMRTYYFSADTQEDMNSWLRAMNQAALMQNHADCIVRPTEGLSTLQQQGAPQTNHINQNTAKTSNPETTGRFIHEVLLEPIRRDADEPGGFHRDAPAIPMETDTHSSLPSNPAHLPQGVMDPGPTSASAPVSRTQSRAPSRAASTVPSNSCTRNGLATSMPSPILEPNGIGAGTYQRSPTPPGEEVHRQGKRRSTLEQVEHWVQVQRAEQKGPPSRDNTLPRRSPATQPKFSSSSDMSYQTLPKTPRHSPLPPPAVRAGEYKYAQDRLSHFRLTPELGGPGGGAVWQLYEWQQRHQFRHGSPTAPLYNPAPDYPFGPRPPSTVPPSSAPQTSSEGHPRCIVVPPSSADLPPPGPPPGSNRTMSPVRRPHTPAERVTVLPVGDRSEMDIPMAASPRRAKSQLLKAATMERRSMPPSGYITHTVSAPSLHGKTADDTYLQLKKDLEYLDLKIRALEPLILAVHSILLHCTAGPLRPLMNVVGSRNLKESGKPIKVAESDVDVKLSQLCEQDNTLKELEGTISSLKDDKDKLESVLDISRLQMEQYQDQPAHAQKIAYQQRLLQEDLVAIRAQISRVSTEMARAWKEYISLESSVDQLRTALQAHMNHSATPQLERNELKRELWRIEDVMAGLSASKANYNITVDSIQNPERKLVPLVPDTAAETAQLQPPPWSCAPSHGTTPPLWSSAPSHGTTPKWAEDGAPPRPPLPSLYDYEDVPPVVPPLPRESSVIRHTSVRGLKRQSDERKRDREIGPSIANGDCKVELRSYLSEPELPVMGRTSTSTGSALGNTSFSDKGLLPSGLNQFNAISSYVTLRRGPGGSQATRERPKSALDHLCPPSHGQQTPRGRMSAEEQLERMKRHQRALVHERKKNLSQGERAHAGLSASAGPSQRCSSTPRLPSTASDPLASEFDFQEERLAAEGQAQVIEKGRIQSKEWVMATVRSARDMDLETLDYNMDISRELSKPRKVPIPERYVESDPEEPLSPEEIEERSRKAARIKMLLAKSSVQNMQPSSGVGAPLDFSELDSVLQQQERIMSVSHALASEASRKGKLVAARAVADN